MQLPFAVIPLIHFTSDRQRMGAFANKAVGAAAGLAHRGRHHRAERAAGGMAIADWLAAAGAWKTAGVDRRDPGLGRLPAAAVVGYVEPLMSRWTRKYGRAPVALPEPAGAEIAAPVYHRILVPLDHTALDRLAVSHAAAMGKLYGAALPAPRGGRRHQPGVRAGGLHGRSGSGRGNTWSASPNPCAIKGLAWRPRSPIRSRRRRRSCVTPKKIQPDLVIMGAHGHGGLKDLIFGTTISPVRHHLDVPMLIVRAGKS